MPVNYYSPNWTSAYYDPRLLQQNNARDLRLQAEWNDSAEREAARRQLFKAFGWGTQDNATTEYYDRYVMPMMSSLYGIYTLGQQAEGKGANALSYAKFMGDYLQRGAGGSPANYQNYNNMLRGIINSAATGAGTTAGYFTDKAPEAQREMVRTAALFNTAAPWQDVASGRIDRAWDDYSALDATTQAQNNFAKWAKAQGIY